MKGSARWFAGLLGLNAAVVGAVAIKTRPWIMPDSERYLRLAAGLRSGAGYALATPAGVQAEGWRQPGYAGFVALIEGLGGGATAVVVVQAGLILVVLGLLARLVARRLGARTALAFLALCALYPFLAYGAVMLASDSLALLLVVGGVVAVAGETVGAAGAAGLLLGAAGLVRPNLILLPFVMAGAVALWGLPGRRLRRAVVLAGLAGLVLLPWAVRNQREFGRFSPLPAISGSGAPLLLATWAGRMSHRDFLAYTIGQELTPGARAAGFAAQVEAVNVAAGVPGANITTLEFYPTNAQKLIADRTMRRMGVANLEAHPWIYLEHVAINAVRAWVPLDALTGAVGAVRSAALRWGLLAASLGGFALALVGLAYDWRGPQRGIAARPAYARTGTPAPLGKRGRAGADTAPTGPHAGAALRGARSRLRREPLLVYAAVVMVYFSGTLCWFDTEPRYTGPARALMLVFAAVAVAAMWEWGAGRRGEVPGVIRAVGGRR